MQKKLIGIEYIAVIAILSFIHLKFANAQMITDGYLDTESYQWPFRTCVLLGFVSAMYHIFVNNKVMKYVLPFLSIVLLAGIILTGQNNGYAAKVIILRVVYLAAAFGIPLLIEKLPLKQVYKNGIYIAAAVIMVIWITMILVMLH